MIRRAVKLTDKIGSVWCRLIHDAATWPIRGQYQCRTCRRHFPVPWDATPRSTPIPVLRGGTSPALTRLRRAA